MLQKRVCAYTSWEVGKNLMNKKNENYKKRNNFAVT